MKKLFRKFLAGAITMALIATLAVGVSYTRNIKAANELTISNWTFQQGGIFQDAKHSQETEWGNVYFYDKITMQGTGEALDQWNNPDPDTLTKDMIAPQPSTNLSFTATQPSKGFVMGILKSGWDCTWGPEGTENQNVCNPWGFTGTTKAYISPDHRYKVTFKAKAESLKYGYIDFSSEVKDGEGKNMAPWAPQDGNTMEDGSEPSQYFALDAQEKTFTYIFLDAVQAKELTCQFRFGTFVVNKDGKAYGYGGLNDDISDIIKNTDEKWTGDITISDFTIEDLDPDKPTVAPKPTDPTDPPESSTEAPETSVTPQTSQAPSVKPAPSVKTLDKVTGVKVKNTKKKTIKITWNRVNNAQSYQVEVNKKKYNVTKNSKKIKNKKFKKGKKVKVRVRAVATGYKTGAWSKTVKKKLKK